MSRKRLSNRSDNFHGQSICIVISSVMEIVTEKIHSLVTLDKARDILVWFYYHGIRYKLCIWHNTMLILGRAW